MTVQAPKCKNPFCSNRRPFGCDKCEECRGDAIDLKYTDLRNSPRTPQTRQRTRHYKCGECGSEFDTLNSGACPFCGFGDAEDIDG
jgi:hypothetical protein